MMIANRNSIFAALVIATSIVFFPTPLFAGTEVKFASADLAAFIRLVKPETTALRIDGRRGEFRPGPSLRFAGIEPLDFDVDLNFGADLIDLRFNNLRGKSMTFHFEEGRARLDFAVEDQPKAIRSALGSISLKEVVVSAWVKFAPDGSARVVYDGGAIIGELKGSGLLKPRWVVDALRNSILKSLKTQLERQLARPNVQESVEKGLVTWGRFSNDDRLSRVTPNSVRVSIDGIRFEAE